MSSAGLSGACSDGSSTDAGAWGTAAHWDVVRAPGARFSSRKLSSRSSTFARRLRDDWRWTARRVLSVETELRRGREMECQLRRVAGNTV